MLLGGRLTQASRLGNASKIGPFFLKYAVPISQKTCRATDGAVTGGLRLLGGGGDRALEHDILWSSYRYGTGAYSRSGVVCQEGERLVRYFVDCGDSGICELWLDRRRVLPVEEKQLLDRFTGMA